jgi:hypothetical protein
MNFIVVSKCYEKKFHVDWDDSLTNEAFTVIIPIQLVHGAEPEIIMEVGKLSRREEHQVKYDAQYAYIWGAETVHCTAPCQYTDKKYRCCLSVSVAYITYDNVEQLLCDFTQEYPPRCRKLILKWAANPHWRKQQPMKIYLPIISEKQVFGKVWIKQMHKYNSLEKSHGIIISSKCTAELHPWISTQRQNYCIKHGYRTGNMLQYYQSCGRSMMNARELMLKMSGFVFVTPRDSEKNQHNWGKMMLELLQFKSKNGHLDVKAKHGGRLYSWVRRQRRELSKTKLTEMQLTRKKKLVTIGFRFEND